MERKNLKSVSDNLNKYSYVAKDCDYITITEWANGDGYDIVINDKLIALSNSELEAINYLILALRYKDNG